MSPIEPLRRRAHASVRSLWKGEPTLSGVLWRLSTTPLAAVYGAVMRLRNAAYDRGWVRSHRPALPVISVGNLTVGGTGKTPVSSWIVRTLQEMGYRPALLARGYGVDELLLHQRWTPEAPVLGFPDRLEGVRRAQELGCDVVVLDDGFQHRRVERALDLVLLSPTQPFPPRLLPRGPYREPLSSAWRADLLLVTSKPGDDELSPQLAGRLRGSSGLPPVHIFHLVASGWTDLTGEPTSPPESPLLLVTSIADPEGFLATVASVMSGKVELHAFPDHHEYRHAEVMSLIAKAGNRAIVTTEKDAVKLRNFLELRGRVKVLTLSPQPEAGLAVTLRARMREVLPVAGPATTERAAP